MGRAVLAACGAIAVAALGCLPSPKFDCTDSTACGSGGTCQPDGLCSFADTSCTSGQRYGSLAGNDSNQCVAVPPCVGMALGGVTGHLYSQLDSDASWDSAVAQCTGSGGYLAVPASQQELNAILNATGGDTWMGIRENGSAFDTPSGLPVEFLPWDSGQPDGHGPVQCVSAVDGDQAYALANCSISEAAMCECNPPAD
jgi:hypothetical protein